MLNGSDGVAFDGKGDGFTFSGEPEETPEQTLARLAKFRPLKYDQVRQAEADRLGVRVTTLDAEVAKARGDSEIEVGQGRKLTIARPIPWPEPVNGTELLNDIARFLSRYVFLPPGAADAIAAWTLHTFCFERFRHTARLGLTSSDPRCGKTTALDAVEMISCKPLGVANISNAALFRTIELVQPTLLIDEADTFLRDNDDLRGALNAGHKRGGQVIRCVGDDADPRLFSVFAPAAIAAIGTLPGTLADRAIQIRMQRCTQIERPDRLDAKALEEGTRLARMAARWCQDHADQLPEAPRLPPELFNRTADNWRPLFAIVAVAGGGWFERLTAAAALLMPGDDDESRGIKLLIDIKAVFAIRGTDQISSRELVEELIAIETSPWAEANKGKPITQNSLARLLKPYRVRPKDLATGTGSSVKGYAEDAFAEVWERYLPDDPQAGANQPRCRDTPRETSGFAESQPRYPESPIADANQRSSASEGGYRGIADGGQKGSGASMRRDGWL